MRRLEHDLREVSESFPERKVVRIDLDSLPYDAPELQLSRLLQRNREAKEERLANAAKQQRTASMLVVKALQKRLLSSPYAFSRTLDVQAQEMEELRCSPADPPAVPRVDRLQLLLAPPSTDDERSELPEDIVADEEEVLMAAATEASVGPSKALKSEMALLDKVRRIATQAKHLADSPARVSSVAPEVRVLSRRQKRPENLRPLSQGATS